jgi:uncharacterized integral membrane protein
MSGVKRILWLFVAIPVAVLLIVFSVANRGQVTMVLDPFSAENPAISVTLPFFVFLFGAFLAGLLVGGLVAWIGQGRHRRLEKRFAADAATWRKEAEAQKNRADTLAAQQGSGIAAIAAAGRNAA